MLGVITYEREGVLRLTPAEHAEVWALDVASSEAGELLSDWVREHRYEERRDARVVGAACAITG